MMHVDALELRTRAARNHVLVVVLTRRRQQQSAQTVRIVSAAAAHVEVPAVALDVDAPENQPFLDEVGAELVPEVLALCQGVVVDRVPGAASPDDCVHWIDEVCRRTHRPGRVA